MVLWLTALTGSAQENAPLVSGPWTEAVVSVSDLNRTAAFFEQVGGYEIRWRGRVDRDTLSFWNLPESARARTVLLAPRWAQNGLLRLVQFEGIEQVPMRPGARPWDTGCYFSLMTRGKDLDLRYREAVTLGWWTESEIIPVDFDTSKLKTVVFQGPDGLYVAVYERLSPPLDPYWPEFDRLTQPFNAMQFVRDRDATYRFFTEVLGFATFYKGEPFVDEQPTYSNFSIPTALTTSTRRLAGIVYPEPGEVGRMEFLQMMDLKGRDYSDRCLPPNLGIMSIRYPVQNINTARETIRQREWPVLFDGTRSFIGSMGTVTMFAIQSPDGAIIEFIEVM